MAGLACDAVTGEITTGTSIKSLLQIIAPTHQRLKIKEISVSFKGTSNTDAPIKVRVLRQTTAGTMSALTPVKHDGLGSETIQSTAQHTATAEPTASDLLLAEEVHPQQGYTWQAPFGGEIIVPGAGRVGIDVTAGVSVSAIARMIYEE